jgi:glycosyltransferase involved in cell wall biosynthesis
MKFLFVLEHYEPYLGGAEKLFSQITQQLVIQGHEVQVITTLFRPDLPPHEMLNGIQVQRVKCYNRFLFTVLSLPAIWAAANKADIIHTTTYNAAPAAWLIAKLRRKKVLITYHEHWGNLWFQLPFLTAWQRWLYYYFERLVSRLPFDHYVAVSEATKESLIGAANINPKRITRIYNGLEYQTFPSHKTVERTPHFSAIFVGRLGVSKGLDLLVPAWGAFSQSTSEEVALKLVIPTYPAPMLAKVEALIDQHAAAETIEILHELSREELFEQMQRSHTVVIPSYSEGFCFVAAEAVALDVPIVSSGQAALAEVVSGYFIEIKEQSVTALTIALESAHNSNWQFRKPRHFPLAKAIDDYLALYQRLLNSEDTKPGFTQ